MTDIVLKKRFNWRFDWTTQFGRCNGTANSRWPRPPGLCMCAKTRGNGVCAAFKKKKKINRSFICFCFDLGRHTNVLRPRFVISTLAKTGSPEETCSMQDCLREWIWMSNIWCSIRAARRNGMPCGKTSGGLRNAVGIEILIMWRLIVWRRKTRLASWPTFVCKIWSELTAHHKKNPTKDHINLVLKGVLVRQGCCSVPWFALQDHPFMQCFRTWEPWLLQMTALWKSPERLLP